MFEDFSTLIMLLLPFVLVDTGFKIYAVIDIHKSERRVLLISKMAWTLLVLLVSFAWVVYLLGGRSDDIAEN